jgi:hypothetical protein
VRRDFSRYSHVWSRKRHLNGLAMTAIVLVVKDQGKGQSEPRAPGVLGLSRAWAGRFCRLSYGRGRWVGMTRQRWILTASTEVSGPQRTWSPSVKLNPAAAMCSRDVLPRCPAAGM